MKLVKNYCLLILAMAISLPAMAQDVPAAVKSAFDEKYPNAQNVEWEEEDKGFEAEFEENGREIEALFNADGSWVESEIEVDGKEMPEAVAKSIDRSFAGYEVEDVDQFESSVLGIDLYQIELENGDSEAKVVFTRDGEILAREMNNDDNLEVDFDGDEIEIEEK